MIPILSFCFSVQAQQYDYGFVIEFNSASHTNFDPQKPEDGQFQWNPLFTFGIGGFYETAIDHHFRWRSNVILRQRGYTEYAQIANNNSGLVDYSLQNRFHYLSLDNRLVYVKNHSKGLKISPLFGLSVNLLLYKKLESEEKSETKDVYPVDQYQKNWKPLNIIYVLGLSLFRRQTFYLDLTFARSITPLLAVKTLEVKDWVWSANLAVSISKPIKKDI